MNFHLLPFSLFASLPLLVWLYKWGKRENVEIEVRERPRLESHSSINDPNPRIIATRKMREIQKQHEDRISPHLGKSHKSSLAKTHGR